MQRKGESVGEKNRFSKKETNWRNYKKCVNSKCKICRCDDNGKKNKNPKLEVCYLKKKNELKKENSNEKINRYLMEACERSVLTSDSEEEFEQLTEYLAQCSSEKGKKSEYR